MNIPQNHDVALTSISHRNPVPTATLRRLYELCHQHFRGQAVELRPDESVSLLNTSTSTAQNIRVVVATDLKTGFYVQLADTHDPILTVGRKLAIEGIDPTNSQRNIKFFTA